MTTSPVRGSVAWGLVVLMLAAGLVGGGIAGGVMGVSAAAPDDIPTKPADPGADFPVGSRAYLAEVTVSEVTGWMEQENNGYECDKPKKVGDGLGKRSVTCWPPDGASAFASVYVYFDSDRQVRSTAASCELGPLSPQDYCKRLFKYMVELAFPSKSKAGKQAMRWTVKNADNDAATVIAGVELDANLQDHSIDVYPAN